MINHVFYRDFYSGMVRYTCRILIMSHLLIYRCIFASKYFSKTGQLCEKLSAVAWFTHHTLPGPAFINMV